MDWQIATQTHRGNVRRLNEDALLAEKNYPLLMIADGMGGHEAGDVASNMLAEKLSDLNLADGLYDAVEQVKASIVKCNDSLIDYARHKLGGQTIGSTVVAMLADDSTGVCIWAGDSRLYRVRDRELQQLTGDHSYVAELVRSGQLSDEEAAQHPSSNVITRAVGAATELDLDSDSFDIRAGDTYLLCSDGLYNEVTSDELLWAMKAADIWQSSQQLLDLCLSRQARDNVSFIINRALPSAGDNPDATRAYYPHD